MNAYTVVCVSSLFTAMTLLIGCLEGQFWRVAQEISLQQRHTVYLGRAGATQRYYGNSGLTERERQSARDSNVIMTLISNVYVCRFKLLHVVLF